MKVERKQEEPKFVPIVITLETKEEADLLWHRLNCTEEWRYYAEERGVTGNQFILWSTFDSKYCPYDKRL